MIIKAVVDVVLLFTIGWRADSNILYMQLAWVVPYIAVAALFIRVTAVTILNYTNLVYLSIGLVTLYFTFAFIINTA